MALCCFGVRDVVIVVAGSLPWIRRARLNRENVPDQLASKAEAMHMIVICGD